ncbi:hypothetical protein SPRG_19198 [Saprolegnia parasitica CBS 223.65]|uniref:Uncharacterized protein n=1 Tax=Saprolegnia parasitica (strain CBS 223.65) TaxID=695850 RepID=A0A067D4B3_SAPPC|nr:hypothetical protein SPRG_19198 [Saprolegnia parasitica CBS 223.65]KDO33566.1 hypothetical protein SPRG_19198 [Saprolegnia parasitica CBS 223.65]|eukprot:XP_012195622.1 hypothetical protein SPRG_19198 [Saprolegnia parasitica CBS 223.65]
MGAAATVARKYRVRQRTAQGWHLALDKYHALLQEADRRGFNKAELDALLLTLRQRHLQLLARVHSYTDPAIATMQPYYDKYAPIIQRHAKQTYKRAKVVVDHVEYVITTTTLQAIYQARRQVVSQLSDATIASYFDIPLHDIASLHVSKRRFSIANAGCDFREHEIEHTFSITDHAFIRKLLTLQWVPWQPIPSVAMKLVETFILDISFASRNEFAIKVPARVVLRVGPKWIGEDVRHESSASFAHPRWLQRIDFQERESRSTLFYDLLRQAYDLMHTEHKHKEAMAAAAAEAAARAKAADQTQVRAPALTVLTPEMIRRTLQTCAERILDEDKFQFYTLSSYENWRMELQDTRLCGQTIEEICEEEAMMREDDLLRLYAARVLEGAERVHMENEDVNRALSREELAAAAMAANDIDVESDWENDGSDDDGL